jgi:hypothetical protein
VFFSHNATFTTLKGEITHVLTYYYDEYTQATTEKLFSNAPTFSRTKTSLNWLISSHVKKIKKKKKKKKISSGTT